MTKTFTVGEAEVLLPVLESLLRRAQEAVVRKAGLEREMQDLSQRIFLSGGMHVNVAVAARRRAERDKAGQEAKDAVGEIEAIGAQVQDLDAGLLDFPCLVEGRTVLLCWRQGETGIGFWHSQEDGFAGRKPLGMLFGKRERERLN